jgi:flagellar biosynthesis component FlhA
LRWVTRMVRALVEEGVPLTTPRRILEGLAAAPRDASLPDAIGLVRRGLADMLPGTEPDRRRLRLGPGLEAAFAARWRASATGGMFALEPETLQEFLSAIRTEVGTSDRAATLVVREQRLRPYVRYLTRDEWPDLPILSREELPPSLDLEYEHLEKVDLD